MTAYSLLRTRVNELQQAQNYDIDFERIVTKLEELYEQIKPLIDIYKTKSPSKQAAKIWEERYYMTYADGKRDESLEDAIRRIARSIAAADVKYAKNAQQLHRLEKIYFDIFSARLMLLNSPALFNLGVSVPKEPYFTKESPTLEDYQYIFDNMDRRKTLHACYPMDIDDDLKAIFNTLKDAALISAAGGGIGINFSKLRPQYSRINTAGFSSGSVSFMQLFDTMGAIILQGGKRRFAGMATHGFADWQITDFWNAPVSFHPDIISFIHSKEHNTGESMLSRFNISVGINNSKDFLKAIDENRAVPLSFMGKRMSEIVFDAHKDKVADSISASDLFYDIVTLAWKTGDPGLIFWDKINKFNPIRELVPMVSVNPCGEKPAISSYKYRIITPCDLGSIDVYKFTTTKDVMWRELLAISQIGAYILDVLHELMMHPTPAIKKGVLLFRDIGLGFFGLAGALIKLFIPYDSPQGRAIAYGIMKAIEVGATRMSRFVGGIKGTYLMAPYVDKSIYVAQVWHKDHKQYENILRMYSAKYQDVVKLYEEEKAIMQEYGNSIYRNFVRTSVAPTGTISILAQTDEDEDVGSGIEPIYAYKYKRYVVSKDNQTKDIVTYKTKLLRYARNADISILESWLDEHDNFEGISKVYPELEDVERVFASAHTIAPEDHLYMLEAVQWACSNGVSKTINLRREATIDDVAHIYRLALASPVIKGITIYRDGSLDTQVLVSESKDKKESAPSFIVQDIKLNTVSIDKEDDSTWQRHAKGFLIHPETGQAVCPVCHSEIIFKEGCISCSNSDCGWSACS